MALPARQLPVEPVRRHRDAEHRGRPVVVVGEAPGVEHDHERDRRGARDGQLVGRREVHAVENTARSCSTRFWSPTGGRSRSASSGRCASSASARSASIPRETAPRCTSPTRTRRSCSGRLRRPRATSTVERILDAAQRAGAQAVHPGYGFLAENAAFAQAVEDAGLVWIGPPPAAIELMGSKTAARTAMQAAGVPIIPGTTDPVGSVDELLALGDEIGYPAPDQGGGRRRRQGHGGSARRRRRPSRRSSAPGGRGSPTSRTRTSTSRS